MARAKWSLLLGGLLLPACTYFLAPIDDVKVYESGGGGGGGGAQPDATVDAPFADATPEAARGDGGVGGLDATTSDAAPDANDSGQDASDSGKDAGVCTGLLAAPLPRISLSADNNAIGIADFNGDMKLDAVIPSRLNNTASVILGNGDGTFMPRVSYPTNQNPVSLAVGDLNGDQNADVVATSTNGGGGTVSVLLGTGTGALQARVNYTTGQGTVDVAIADLNGDNKRDVLAVNNTDNTVSVLLGNGDGTLQPKADYTVGMGPGFIAVADVNADTVLDVLVINAGANTLSVLLGNGNGTLQTKVDYPTSTTPTALALADVNGDGKIDIVASNSSNSVTPSVVSVLLGNGNGTFMPMSTVVTGRFPSSVRLADLDGDGKVDIVAACAGDDTISVNRGNGDGTFRPVESYSTGANTAPSSVSVADLNRDGKLDVIVLLSGVDQGTVLLNSCP